MITAVVSFYHDLFIFHFFKKYIFKIASTSVRTPFHVNCAEPAINCLDDWSACVSKHVQSVSTQLEKKILLFYLNNGFFAQNPVKPRLALSKALQFVGHNS